MIIKYNYGTSLQTIALRQALAQELQTAAALTIQSVWRGRLARIEAAKARNHLLSYALFERAKPYVDIPEKRRMCPRAASGLTPVFLPPELPVVLKWSGSLIGQARFEQMNQARELCVKNRYTHLVIPRARVYGKFIIETRLPVGDTKQQIGLYMENRDRFAGAAKEFIGFLCQSALGDIVKVSGDYCSLFKVHLGKYENVTLYLEEEEGKIGLIDMGSSGLSFGTPQHCIQQCEAAISFFPYHLDEILAVAREYDPEIDQLRESFEKRRDATIKAFQDIYADHLEFIRKKGITLDSPITFEKPTADRTEALRNALSDALKVRHREGLYKGLLGKDPTYALAQFNETTFPKLLNTLYSFIEKSLNFQLLNNSPVLSMSQLPSIRTLVFEFRDIPDCIDFKELELDGFMKYGLRQVLYDVFFKELARCGEIAYYKPQADEGWRESCIFV